MCEDSSPCTELTDDNNRDMSTDRALKHRVLKCCLIELRRFACKLCVTPESVDLEAGNSIAACLHSSPPFECAATASSPWPVRCSVARGVSLK